MQWIEISVVCERVATDEVTTLFDNYADNGIIEEDVEDQPNLIKLSMYSDCLLYTSYDAKEAGFTDINIDLIYGLPRQTLEDIQHNLDIVKDLPINHISTYGLQVEVGTYLYHLVQKNLISIPSETIDESMYDTMMEGLKDLGFERYEISNFAKANSYSRHNLKYWHYIDYLGFGAGAHSFYDGVRRSNNRNVCLLYTSRCV